jgi:FAD/FMN-containing dehydrogenase
MNLAPANLSDLRETLAAANARGEKIGSIDLSALNHIINHTPADMTCTVEAGVTLGALQRLLIQRRQWLPIDPSRPDRLTIGQLLANNESGPRRHGFGTIREHLLGITVVLADGRIIKSGGKVVKNVAGFDLCKLFVGAKGSLGVIVEATFKLQPLPESEAVAGINCDSFAQAGQMIERIMHADLSPVVLDLHNMTALQLVVGFAGARANVDWQLARAQELHMHRLAGLNHPEAFWRDDAAGPLHKLSVLPSKLPDTLASLGGAEFLAGAGDGLVWYRGGPVPPPTVQPMKLLQRVKDAYDPKHILPDIPT